MKPFKKSVVGGALILSIAGVIVKVLGMLYKLPLAALLREEGMGYFNSAYTVYSFFFLLSTAGLPVAVSILVSSALSRTDRGRRDALRILRVTITCFAAVGLVVCILLVFLAERFADWIGNPPAASAIAAIAPALLFVCILSALRGYFQGCGNMLPTALSQIVEAAGKLTFGILLARWAMLRYKDASSAASFAILGVTIGTFLALLCLLPAWIRETRRAPRLSPVPDEPREGVLTITKRLIKIALPVTLSSSVMSLAGLLDLFLVLRRLTDAGYTPEVANALYGSYSGLAVTLANMPTVLITPIACAAVPLLSSALSRGRAETARTVAHTALRVTVLIAAPCAVGMSLLSPQILRLLFDDAMANGAAPYLTMLAPSILFIALCNVSGALLQAMGKVKTPLLSMTAGAAVKLISAWFLLGEYGIQGAPVSTFLCYLTITALNFIALTGEGVTITFRSIFGVSLFAALACGATALFGMRLFEGRMGDLACIPAAAMGALVYLLLLLMLGGITRAEWRLIPGGRAICRRLEKWKLLR
ncbi:MAG: polysaccharide biosynthesis protein [Clostridia bacterium]|nr:polysaccharide biosynthesis protein [Clostridia bacterium]